MTSDAKIGLLLGLVFIFIIAFVINGLPRFRGASNGSELTTNMVSSQNDTNPIASRERNASGAFNWIEQAAEQTIEENQPPVEEKEDVRFKMQLPDDISMAKNTSIDETAIEDETTLTEQTEPAPPVEITEEKVENPVAKQPEPVEPTKSVWPKSYVVNEDDYLGLVSVAKKLYGAEQGNKKINIDRIFEANRSILKSPDEIYVGQKLTIPSPVTLKPETTEPDSSLADSILEKVKSIGRKHLSSKSDETKQTIPYVVRQDDNLWRIAAEQLGNGNRYKEISKLNSNIIKNENDLEVGMLLRLPAQ
jgi:nucleoid-associated protein YgaU